MVSWDERYGSDDYVYGKQPNTFLSDNVERLQKGKVLCLADGEGRNGVYLATRGFDVTAMDSSAVGLKKAERLARESGISVKTIVADLSHYPIDPDSWDSIVSIFCHVPKEVRIPLHRRVVSGLKRGGVLLLEAYTPEQLKYGTGGPPDEEKLMTLNDLRNELTGLEFVLGREIVRDVVEGRLHTGKGAVVQVIGRKL